MASAPPPAGGNPAGRTLTIQFESGRRLAPDALRINPHGATLEVDGFFHTPLKLTLGQLHLGMVDRGSAKVKGQVGRFPILKRLSATAVVPREQGIEGWLWTSTGGSALTVVGDEDAAPSGALLFTKPLTAEQLEPTMETHAFEALADRSPLGVPAILGLLFRVAEPVRRRDRVSLLRPAAPAHRPRGAAHACGGRSRATDPPIRRSPAARSRAPVRWPRPASEYPARPMEHDPGTCTACRGSGELISGLGGEPHRVRCPWCDGTGRFDAARDAQAPAREGHPADNPGR